VTDVRARLIDFVRDRFRTSGPVPLHAPTFGEAERGNLLDCLSSTFVSSVGPFVDKFERAFAERTGAVRAVAVVNGTAGLHAALHLAGVGRGDLVVTQSLTFVATCNAISYCGAKPLFADIDRDTLGLSPKAVDDLLSEHAEIRDSVTVMRADGRRIRACVPMHTFGHPVDLDGLEAVCRKWGLTLIEDAAEALGSLYRERHVGLRGSVGAFSLNGNKIITTGGGGMLIFADETLASRAQHLTTTAKVSHPWEFEHDAIGFNYRMPNLNAALGYAQLERLDSYLEAKRSLAKGYAEQFAGSDHEFCVEPEGSRSNYWLCTVACPDRAARDTLLRTTNNAGVFTRPVWIPMHQLSIYADAPRGSLPITEDLADRLVNLPSSAPSVAPSSAG
jgi:aminotransferase in exopolysaccharide biosynthesis